MRATSRLLAVAMLLVLAVATVAEAGPFEDGLAAEQRGDYVAAGILYRKAAEHGEAIAQFTLGIMYDNGEGVPRDYAEAVKWYRRAAEQGVANAQFSLGVMYDNGEGVPEDDAEAVKWYRRAAEQGFADAQFNLGVMYDNGEGVPEDDAEAAKWYRSAAEQGGADAQFNLGSMYSDGRGVGQDYAEAVKWYRRAAEQGFADAQFNLGVMYYAGEGVRRDYVEAANWSRKAAEQGDERAQLNLGILYHTGEGVPRDYAEAVKWYRRAAEQGFADAQFNLGVMYYAGEGVRRDYVEAANWYRKAAEQGCKITQHLLGVMYVVGEGVPQDYVQAYQWLNLSAAQGDAEAAADRDATAAAMTLAQVAEAQKLSREWKPNSAPTNGGRSAPLPCGVRRISKSGGDEPPSQAGTAARGPSVTPAPSNAEKRAKGDPSSTGSALFVSPDGYLVTNHHVVDGCRRLATTVDGHEISVGVVHGHKANDLAVLKAAVTPSRFGVFATKAPRAGDTVVAAGFPLRGYLATQATISVGSVANLSGPDNDVRLMQLSCPVQPGNSGGPVLDEYGRVTGIIASKLDALLVAAVTGTLPENVNFAIKSNLITSALDAAGVKYQQGDGGEKLPPADVGTIGQQIAVPIDCWR